MEYISIVFSAILVGFAIYFYIWLLILLPRRMAKKRGRNIIGWTILFWIFNPLCGAILLLVLGDSNEKIKQDILNEIDKNKIN